MLAILQRQNYRRLLLPSYSIQGNSSCLGIKPIMIMAAWPKMPFITSSKNTTDIQDQKRYEQARGSNRKQSKETKASGSSDEVVFWEGLYEGQAFFEKVAKLHEDMSKMDDRVFGLALRLISKTMYKELVGSTAVRKSLKIKDIIDEYAKRLPQITDKEDLVNYTYFLTRLTDFEIAYRFNSNLKNQLIQRSIESSVKHAQGGSLDFNEVLRNFGDIITLDPALALSNKILDIVKNEDEEQKGVAITMGQYQRILKYVLRAKNPRLYVQLVKQVINKLHGLKWREENLKSIIFMYGQLAQLENVTYSKFEFLSDMIKEIVGRKAELTQADVLKVLEGAILMRHQTALQVASQMQNHLQKNISSVLGNSNNSDEIQRQVGSDDITTHFFLLRFWSHFVQIPNSDHIIMEELFKQSLESLRQSFIRFNLGVSGDLAAFAERDFKNTMVLIDFCLKHNSFPSQELLKDIFNELLSDYDKNVFKLKQENQEHFIRLARNIYQNDMRSLERAAEISISSIKKEATTLKFLCNGLEIFEQLDIVKHESRRMILGKLKTLIVNNEFKVKDLLYMIQLYPNKIKTKAFEQLVELALQKASEKQLFPNVDQQLQIIFQLTKAGVSPRIAEVGRPLMSDFLNSTEHSSKVLNLMIDQLCQQFDRFDGQNHLTFLRLLSNQKELVKVQREMLIHYLARVVSSQHIPSSEPLWEYIRDAVGDILTSQRLDGPLKSVNDFLVQEFQVIVEHLPIEKCDYIFECLDQSASQSGANRLGLKIADLACRYFPFKDNKQMLINLLESLTATKFFDNVEQIKRIEIFQQVSSILSTVSSFTNTYDALSVQIAQRLSQGLLDQEKNPDNSLTTLKKVACLTMFPPHILEAALPQWASVNVGEGEGTTGASLAEQQLQKVISNQFFKILPFMAADILATFPFKADPFMNKVSRYFFFSFENVYLNKFISQHDSPNKSGGSLFQSKIQYDHYIVLEILRKLALKRVNVRPVHLKLRQIVQERKMVDSMSASEIIEMLQYQGVMGKQVRDLETLRYLFKKRLPEIVDYIQSQESMIRGILQAVATFDLGQEKVVQDFCQQILPQVGGQDQGSDEQRLDNLIPSRYLPQLYQSLLMTGWYTEERFKPMFLSLKNYFEGSYQSVQRQSSFADKMNLMYAYLLHEAKVPEELKLSRDTLFPSMASTYLAKLKGVAQVSELEACLQELYPSQFKLFTSTSDNKALIHCQIEGESQEAGQSLCLQLRAGPNINMEFEALENKYLLATFDKVAYIDLQLLVRHNCSFEDRCAYVKSIVDSALNANKNSSHVV